MRLKAETIAQLQTMFDDRGRGRGRGRGLGLGLGLGRGLGLGLGGPLSKPSCRRHAIRLQYSSGGRQDQSILMRWI